MPCGGGLTFVSLSQSRRRQISFGSQNAAAAILRSVPREIFYLSVKNPAPMLRRNNLSFQKHAGESWPSEKPCRHLLIPIRGIISSTKTTNFLSRKKVAGEGM